MTDFQDAKALVQAQYADLLAATTQDVATVLARRMTADALWRGVDPFGVVAGPDAAADAFWGPYLRSFAHVKRREDIFFAGLNEIDGFSSVWTCSMGHLQGLFDAPWLGIPATRKIAMLRYAEFTRVQDGQIVEVAFFCDILHLMRQAGIVVFPDQTAQHLVQPGPLTGDGRLLTPQDAAEGEKTLARINTMIGSIDAANRDPRARTPREELLENWTEDFTWWGPEGIGATYTIDRYIEQHQGPFRQHIADRSFNGHLCRMAEGTYGAFFGWPNLTITNAGAYMGVPGNDVRADLRVVDVYRREGEKLAENWIFFDTLHWLGMQGVDVLGDLGVG